MALEGTGEGPGAPEFSFTKLLLTVQSLEDELAAAKRSAKKAASERDVARLQTNGLREQLTACNAEMQKKLSDLQKDLQHWTARAKAAESEKEESSNQAATLTLQLQKLMSSRDSNQQALKEKQYKLDLEIGLKTEECNTMQQQLQSYAGLLVALETELARGREALTDARSLVSENCKLVSRHEQKLQGAIIGEERFLEKSRRQATAFKAMRARLQEKEEALKQLSDGHEKATKQLVSSEAEVAALRRTVGLLETEVKEHITAKNTLLHSLQRSNAVLAELRNAAEQHTNTLDSMRLRLHALDAEAFEAAASNAVKVKEQGTELAALRAEVAQLRSPFTKDTASLAIVTSLDMQSAEDANHEHDQQRGKHCGQQEGRNLQSHGLLHSHLQETLTWTSCLVWLHMSSVSAAADVCSKVVATELTPDTVVEQRTGKLSEANEAGSDQSSEHQGHTPMDAHEDHVEIFQSSPEHVGQKRLQTTEATLLKSAGICTAKPTHDAPDAFKGKEAAAKATVPAQALTAKTSLASQDFTRQQPGQESLRCPESTHMRMAGLQQVHACRNRPWEHSPGTSLEASATAFSADTPDELELDCDDSVPCARQAERVQQSPPKANPDTGAIQPTTGHPSQAPKWFKVGKPNACVPLGAHSLPDSGGVSTQSAAQAPSRRLPAAQDWMSRAGNASAQAAAHTAPTCAIAAQDIKVKGSGSVVEQVTVDPDVEQGNERMSIASTFCEPSAKKPRTLQPDITESRHAAQSGETSLARDPIEPVAMEACSAQPHVESKDAAACEGGEPAMNTNAGQINSSPCDVFASFTSFQDLSDDEGHLIESQAGVSNTSVHLASGRNPKRART